MKDMTSNVPPGFNEDGFSNRQMGASGFVSRIALDNAMSRLSPPVGGLENSRRKELLNSLQEGVNKMNDKV